MNESEMQGLLSLRIPVRAVFIHLVQMCFPQNTTKH